MYRLNGGRIVFVGSRESESSRLRRLGRKECGVGDVAFRIFGLGGGMGRSFCYKGWF